jgi:GrpB-like predicted nucleotidyltransferase (UPF0157 family)
MAPIVVSEYDPTWPLHFKRISLQIQGYLSTANVPYITIEHIGSTAIPNIAAKPNIDIIILVEDAATAEKAREALTWTPPASEHYKSIGNGGIKGRISMKFQDRKLVPDRSVYIIAEDDEDGMIGLKGYRDLKKILSGGTVRRKELKEEYEDVKWEIVAQGIDDIVDYGRKKNVVVRKILKEVGWTDEEIKRKEDLDVRKKWEDEDYL